MIESWGRMPLSDGRPASSTVSPSGMAQFVPGFKAVAAKPDKFCHGFGIFQYDLQFFERNPDYFLKSQYADFKVSVRRVTH